LPIAAAGVVGLLLTRRPPSKPALEDATRIRALEVRVAALEATVRRQSAAGAVASEPRVHLIEPPVVEMDGSQRVERPAKPSVAKTVEVNEAAALAEYFGELDSRLGAEGRDATWAASTEENFRTTASETRPKIGVENPRCGQTMCRVETAVQDLREDSAALEKFITGAVAYMAEAVVRDGAAPGRHVVYFARKGVEFPPMNSPEPTIP